MSEDVVLTSNLSIEDTECPDDLSIDDEETFSAFDNGKGFAYDASVYNPGNGIYNMKERARLLNGSLDIESEPLAGTTVRLKIPKQINS